MKVEYSQGLNAKTFESMDIESRCAVMDAVEQVRDKRGFEKWAGKPEARDCYLSVVYGHNIYTTSITIYSKTKHCCAFYWNGNFYDVISKTRVNLI